MRYEVHKALKRQVEQDPTSNVYFWDGEVCVYSSAITIGNPPTVTISVNNLTGVSVQREEQGVIVTTALCILVLFFWVIGFSCLRQHPVVSSFFLLLSAWPIYSILRSRPWLVTLKQGGVLSDESFSSRSQEWAEKLGQAIGQAIMASRSSGSGGQSVTPEAIFPDPVLTRN